MDIGSSTFYLRRKHEEEEEEDEEEEVEIGVEAIEEDKEGITEDEHHMGEQEDETKNKKKEEEQEEEERRKKEEEERRKKEEEDKKKNLGGRIIRRLFSYKSEKKKNKDQEEEEEEEEEKEDENKTASANQHPVTPIPPANQKPASPVTSANQNPTSPVASANHSTPPPPVPNHSTANTEPTNESPASTESTNQDAGNTESTNQNAGNTESANQNAVKADLTNERADLTLFDLSGQPTRPPRKKKVKGGLWGAVTPDLTPQTPPVKPSTPSWRTLLAYTKDKLDGSFSRSRSSSISSLENISSEAIQCLAFADTYTRKNETVVYPTLWVGTSLGSVIQVTVLLPSSDVRSSTPASVHPSGTIFRVKGSVLTMSFLDCSGGLIPYQYESWRDAQKERKMERAPTKTAMSASSDCRMSPTNSGGGVGGGGGSDGPQTPPQSWTERQFVVIASEKVARVVSLPAQTCVFKQIITEVSFVVKADVVTIKDSVSLVCYIASGHVSVFSLPSLRQLIYVDFLPLVDLRIARTFCFAHHGHGLYLCSPSEIQKFTISADFCNELQELLGNLFMATEMPEPPKQSFFKGLFGGGVNQLDREELFGEASGKASRSVAKHVLGPSSTDPAALSARAGAATSDIGRAKMLAIERGQKLGELEERTAKMVMESESFSSHAHTLMMKYRDKKWYQL